MIGLDRDICFLDTETLGLAPEAPIWEFAAIRIPGPANRQKPADAVEFLIDHDTSYGTSHLPDRFADDYRARYWREFAWPAKQAAQTIHAITAGAVIAGSNPSFDIERLGLLLDRHGLTPAWHYHPLDIPSMVAGWMAADNDGITLQWRSTVLSECTGVVPGEFERHTALGDTRWCLAQWKAMTGAADTP